MKRNISTITTPNKLEELEDIIVDFNKYLEIVAKGLEQLDTGVKAIADNLRIEVEERN